MQSQSLHPHQISTLRQSRLSKQLSQYNLRCTSRCLNHVTAQSITWSKVPNMIDYIFIEELGRLPWRPLGWRPSRGKRLHRASPHRRALMIFADVEGAERTATEGWNTTWHQSRSQNIERNVSDKCFQPIADLNPKLSKNIRAWRSCLVTTSKRNRFVLCACY